MFPVFATRRVSHIVRRCFSTKIGWNNSTKHLKEKSAPTVCIGISGGVDSSVAALLLKRQGYNVIGVHMTNWDSSDEEGHNEDLKMAQKVCRQLDIPLHKVNFVSEYWNEVFEPFIHGYRCGATPNPDVWCNRHVKFKPFLKHCIKKLGADFIATGHYARLQCPCFTTTDSIRNVTRNVTLLSGIDAKKDQSYFLCAVPDEALAKCIFPLGHLTKLEVRNIAESEGLSNAKRKDSYGLCFVGKRMLYKNIFFFFFFFYEILYLKKFLNFFNF
eukprot:GSMAST32.ASY1.ANO1.937.1 assembled CDS